MTKRTDLMMLRYLPINQAWVFTFGAYGEPIPMGGERFFKSRKDAREAARGQNLLVDDRTGVVTP